MTNFPMLPSNPSLFPPNEKFSSLVISQVEVGHGFLTVWGRGNVSAGTVQSGVSFRQFYGEFLDRMPMHIYLMQNTKKDTSWANPRPYDDEYLCHAYSEDKVLDLDHFHLLMPYHGLLDEEDSFHLNLAFQDIGFVNPIPYKEYLDQVPVADRNRVRAATIQRWEYLTEQSRGNL